MSETRRVAVGNDHGGLALKKVLLPVLEDHGFEILDAGTNGSESVDYPDFGATVARQVASGEASFGVLVCGTGIGISIAANKVDGIRAAVCRSEYEARMARAHNDANILCLGERVTGPGLAQSILVAWLEADFEGGRHQRRIDKITDIEKDTIR